MEAASTPRISGPYLDNYVGRNVMVVGKVVQLRGDQAIIDADGNVTAHLNRVSFPSEFHLRRRRRCERETKCGSTCRQPEGIATSDTTRN